MYKTRFGPLGIISTIALGLAALAVFAELGAYGEDAEPLKITNNAVTWSPDGQLFAFHANFDGDDEIYTMRTDGSDLKQITFNGLRDSRPVFSRDGSFIIYEGEVERDGEDNNDLDIFRVPVTGGAPERLFGEAGISEFEAQAMPDGRVSFVKTIDGNADVYTWNPMDGDINRIVDGPAVDVLVRWSDVNRFVYTSNREHDGEHYDVFTADADGANTTFHHLYPDDDTGAGSSSATITPDGKWIIYSSDKGNHPFDFAHYLYNVETGIDEALPREGNADMGVISASADSRYISYPVDYDLDGVKQIAIMNLETREIRHINPAW